MLGTLRLSQPTSISSHIMECGARQSDTRLYFEILKKTETIISHYVQLLELYSDKYVEKVTPTQIDEQE